MLSGLNSNLFVIRFIKLLCRSFAYDCCSFVQWPKPHLVRENLRRNPENVVCPIEIISEIWQVGSEKFGDISFTFAMFEKIVNEYR